MMRIAPTYITIALSCFAFYATLDVAMARSEAGLDADQIGRIVGSKASVTPDGVVRLSWPRGDVPLEVDGVAVKPFAGVGTWAAFMRAGQAAMMMGDTVVFQDEVNPAIDAAFAHGLEVTGLHNHFLFDEPKVFFMHIGGHAAPEKLAEGVKAVWDAIKAVRASNPSPAQGFLSSAHIDVKPGVIDASSLEKILSGKPESKDGMVKFTFGHEAKMHGIKVSGSMGLTTWAAFMGTDNAAAVDGDFLMTAKEVQPVLRALRKAKINIVALHNHMIGEQPSIYFSHFWGKGTAVELAKGIEAARQAQKAVH